MMKKWAAEADLAVYAPYPNFCIPEIGQNDPGSELEAVLAVFPPISVQYPKLVN